MTHGAGWRLLLEGDWDLACCQLTTRAQRRLGVSHFHPRYLNGMWLRGAIIAFLVGGATPSCFSLEPEPRVFSSFLTVRSSPPPHPVLVIISHHGATVQRELLYLSRYLLIGRMQFTNHGKGVGSTAMMVLRCVPVVIVSSSGTTTTTTITATLVSLARCVGVRGNRRVVGGRPSSSSR